MATQSERDPGKIERFKLGDTVPISEHTFGDIAFYRGVPMCHSTTGRIIKPYGSGTVALAECTAEDCGYLEVVRGFSSGEDPEREAPDAG